MLFLYRRLAAGCTGPQAGVSAAVPRLASALTAGDGSAACAALAPATRAAVAKTAGSSCPEAILQENLPLPGAVQTTDVYGQWARVVTAQDTLFLAAFGDGWQVVAAGCRPRVERPYDCLVRGE
jgi:hypothetical protein